MTTHTDRVIGTHPSFVAATLAAIVFGSAMVATAAAKTPKDSKVGTTVTITGCLHEGEDNGSFVLSRVTEVAAPGAVRRRTPLTPAIYWLDSTDGMEALVGKQIDVTGVITKRRSKDGTITIEIRPGGGESETVEVQSNDTSVTSEKFVAGGKPTTRSTTTTTSTRQRAVYKLDVKHVAASVPGGSPALACR